MQQKAIKLDLRKTSLFEKGHIPGAVSFPIFEEGEMAQIQKLTVEDKEYFYFQKSQSLSSKLLDLVGYLPFEYYCQKGEIESRYFKNWFGPEFPEAKTLSGGYNAYRKSVNKSWTEKYNMIVLTGLTGSGKTEVLELLEREGYSILNLEKIAKHKGSVFGTIDGESITTQEQFENEIYQILRHKGPVFTEMKGRYLGQLYLPIQFYEQVAKAPKIFLDVPIKIRVERLVKAYCGKDDEFLKKQLELLKDRLSDEVFNQAKDDLSNSRYKSFIELLLGYYDQSNVYSNGMEDHLSIIAEETPEQIVIQLKKFYPL